VLLCCALLPRPLQCASFSSTGYWEAKGYCRSGTSKQCEDKLHFPLGLQRSGFWSDGCKESVARPMPKRMQWWQECRLRMCYSLNITNALPCRLVKRARLRETLMPAICALHLWNACGACKPTSKSHAGPTRESRGSCNASWRGARGQR
jgi:hypothetical protein